MSSMSLKRMTLISAMLCAVAGWGPAAMAQSAVQPQSVEVDLSMGGYFMLETEPGFKDTFTYGLSGAYNFDEMFGVQLALNAAPREVNQVSVFHVHLDLLVHPLEHEWFVPFVGVGPTFAFVVPGDDAGPKDTDPAFNVLAGIDFYPWKRVGIRAQARYVPRFGVDDEAFEHDLLASFGMFVALGGDIEEEVIVLDTDGDGILDSDDACPTVPGVASAKGCPDADGDTVTDEKDQCPKEPGPVALGGCPDADDDKIVDKDDRCPKIPGTPEHKGCPDTDKDTIADPDDRCPKIPGELAYQGCPPPPPVEIVEKFSGRIQGITFEYNSDEIKPSSFGILDEAVGVLKQYPQLKILVEGHTSSEGELESNMDLSRRRAESVRQYIIDKGVASDRLQAQGFGPKQPVADNATKKGRTLNRRIEFKVLRK